MPGETGVTVVTNARAFYTTRAAAGASGARHSLRPLISEGATCRIKLALIRGEIAKLWLQECCCLKLRLVCTQTHSSCPDLIRASIHLRKKFLLKKMDCRVKPGNDVLTVFAPTVGSLTITAVIPGWSEGPDLRCAIAHRGISRFRVRIFDAPRNDVERI